MPERGDLFVQALGDGRHELNRFSRPDAQALVLSDDELRWLCLAAGPALLVRPSPRQQEQQRAEARDRPPQLTDRAEPQPAASRIVKPPPAGGTGGGQASLLDSQTPSAGGARA